MWITLCMPVFCAMVHETHSWSLSHSSCSHNQPESLSCSGSQCLCRSWSRSRNGSWNNGSGLCLEVKSATAGVAAGIGHSGDLGRDVGATESSRNEACSSSWDRINQWGLGWVQFIQNGACFMRCWLLSFLVMPLEMHWRENAS